jgi:hypothetical protein
MVLPVPHCFDTEISVQNIGMTSKGRSWKMHKNVRRESEMQNCGVECAN